METLSGGTIHRYRYAYFLRAFRKIIASIFYLVRTPQRKPWFSHKRSEILLPADYTIYRWQHISAWIQVKLKVEATAWMNERGEIYEDCGGLCIGRFTLYYLQIARVIYDIRVSLEYIFARFGNLIHYRMATFRWKRFENFIEAALCSQKY